MQVSLTDVVPLPEADPLGKGLVAASFPLTIAGMFGGILVGLLVTGAARKVAALMRFSALSGLLLTLVLQTWFGYLAGDFYVNATAIALSILATSAFITGCTALLGRIGLGLAAVFVLLLANPLASAATPWQFLPAPWGQIGQITHSGGLGHAAAYVVLLSRGGHSWAVVDPRRMGRYRPDADPGQCCPHRAQADREHRRPGPGGGMTANLGA